MRKLASMVAATAFLASTTAAFADGTQTALTPAQPLAPGGASGIHKAQLWFAPAGVWIAGGAIVIVAATVVLLNNRNNHTSSTPSTTQ